MSSSEKSISPPGRGNKSNALGSKPWASDYTEEVVAFGLLEALGSLDSPDSAAERSAYFY